MSWPFSSRVLESVNGTVNTSGRLPPASWAANVGPVPLVLDTDDVDVGVGFSNCASWASKAS